MMKPLSKGVNLILRNLYIKHGGKLFAEIMLYWPRIVGPEISSSCRPLKISNQNSIKLPTTLYVEAATSSISTELSYNQMLIIEKIAVYLGRKAIDKIIVKVTNR